MTDYESAYIELSKDEKYQSFIEQYVSYKNNENVAKIYQHAYNTVYLNNSHVSTTSTQAKELTQPKKEELSEFIFKHFRNRLSPIPYIQYRHLSKETIYIEKDKIIAQREAGAYIIETLPYPGNKEVAYPFIYKHKYYNEALFFYSNHIEQASTYYCRFYLNAKPEHFLTLLLKITQQLESRDLPYTLKHFFMQENRIDNTVLYIIPKYANLVYLILQAIYPMIQPFLQSNSPRFTKRLFDGIAFAECPEKGQSFGMHRCKTLSDYLLEAKEKGSEEPHFNNAFAQHLIKSQINTERPFLNLHTDHNNYTFLHAEGNS